MEADAQSDEGTQHRTAQTKRQQQDDVIHRPRDDLMGLDEDTFLKREGEVKIRVSSTPRPTHSWKQRQQPPRVMCKLRWREDDDQGHNAPQNLKGDGVHVHWEVWGEKSGPALVAVEERRGDLQHFHDHRSRDEADCASLSIKNKENTALIDIGGRNVNRRHKQSLTTQVNDRIENIVQWTHLIARWSREGCHSTGNQHTIHRIQTDEQPNSISRLFDLVRQSDQETNTPKKWKEGKGKLDPKANITRDMKERWPNIESIDCPNDNKIKNKDNPNCQSQWVALIMWQWARERGQQGCRW
jgi:hypothetical protein